MGNRWYEQNGNSISPDDDSVCVCGEMLMDHEFSTHQFSEMALRCKQCNAPVDDSRRHWATPVCFKCVKPKKEK